MMLKLGRIAVVSTAALTLAATTIPTKAEAFGCSGDCPAARSLRRPAVSMFRRPAAKSMFRRLRRRAVSMAAVGAAAAMAAMAAIMAAAMAAAMAVAMAPVMAAAMAAVTTATSSRVKAGCRRNQFSGRKASMRFRA